VAPSCVFVDFWDRLLPPWSFGVSVYSVRLFPLPPLTRPNGKFAIVYFIVFCFALHLRSTGLFVFLFPRLPEEFVGPQLPFGGFFLPATSGFTGFALQGVSPV